MTYIMIFKNNNLNQIITLNKLRKVAKKNSKSSDAYYYKLFKIFLN